MLDISKKLADKIKAGEYVDFTELPSAKGKSRPLSSLTKKDLPDLATQTQCFAMFVRVVCEHQPQRIGGLMTYLSLIT